jgi:hypothetical protein
MPNIHNFINVTNLYSNFMLIQINQHQSKHKSCINIQRPQTQTQKNKLIIQRK